jgi:hypothetical protein
VGGVVAMMVRDEKAQRRTSRDEIRAEGAHPLGRAYRPHPRVDEEALTVGFDDQAVAAGAAP